jgi:hypothetical protein
MKIFNNILNMFISQNVSYRKDIIRSIIQNSLSFWASADIRPRCDSEINLKLMTGKKREKGKIEEMTKTFSENRIYATNQGNDVCIDFI